MAFLNDEIPSGIINGSNKVFTLLNAPFDMVSVEMDGANYTTYSVSGNVLTLSDAPTLSLFVDYSTGSTFIPETNDVTLGDIKTKIWNLLGETSSSTTFSSDVLGETVNRITRQVCRGRVTSVLDQNRIYRAGKLWFMEGNFPIRVQAGSMVTEDFLLGDTTISCATTGLLGAGYVEIGGEVIKYTGTDENGLTGVSGATIDHLTGEAINQLYTVPVDFERPQTVSLIISGQQARSVELPLDPNGTDVRYYQIIRSGTLQLIKIVGVSQSSLVKVIYTKRLTDMGDDSDINPLPDDYGISVLAYLSAGTLAFEHTLPTAQQILLVAYENLQNMYQFFTNTTNVIKQSIKPIPYNTIVHG